MRIDKITEETQVYLKSNVQVEPLICNWYAWHHIIPPTLTALNIVERYIPIMESYIASPEAHQAAIKDPALRGGPFIDLVGDRSEDVKKLLIEMKEEGKSVFEFVNAIRELDALLKEKAEGYTMEELYPEIPEILKGYVELYYDRHHRPDFRFYESLLYKSPFFLKNMQSVRLSLIKRDSERPFIFSTPRLPSPNELDIKIPFSDNRWSELFKMKKEAKSYGEIKKLLEITPEHEHLFAELFTTKGALAYKKYDGDEMRIRYFGHACILMESKDVSILMDPILSYTYENDVPRFTYEDLPDTIDYVLITHGHHDHILLETILQIRHKVKHIVVGKNIDGALQDPSLKLLLRELGFESIIELAELETIQGSGVKITGIPFIGEHHDLHIASKLCYHIEMNGKSLMAMADSCNHSPELYQRVHDTIGDVDVLFLGMECDGAPVTWAYGPIFSEKPERKKDYTRRGRGSNFLEGIDLVHTFNVKQIYVYAMGAEPWVTHLLDVHYTEYSNPIVQSDILINTCGQEGRSAERLYAEKELSLTVKEKELVE